MKILPWKKGLNSAALLRDQGAMLLSPNSRPKRGSIVMSWGCSKTPTWGNRVKWINNPAILGLVSDKKTWANFCTRLAIRGNPYVLTYYTSKEVAQLAAETKGAKIMCRTLLNGSGGKGIVVARNPSQVVDAPLYSIYAKKTAEYRVIWSHLLGAVYVASKRRPEGSDMNRDELLIRTLDSGYVYQTESVDDLPDEVLTACRSIGTQLHLQGLEFAGYDVLYNSNTGICKVVEVNSAPGLNDDSSSLVYQALEQLEAMYV